MLNIRNTISEPDKSSISLSEPFDAFVMGTYESLGHVSGISVYDQFMNPEACITAYKEGLPKLEELFKDVELIAPISTPMIKYGHMNSLGVPLSFPETGQVAMNIQPTSLEEVIKIFERKNDFMGGLTKKQISYLETVKRAFPGKRVHWGWQWEGPVTTLWGLSGTECMYSVADDPDLFKKCLAAITDSLADYAKFYCFIDGTSVLDPYPDHGRICDDIAAMFSPSQWPEFVIPFWTKYYEKAPVPMRKLHCEDMRPAHLPLLDCMNITDYDSGISPKINPAIINERTKTPFCWRHASFIYDSMTVNQAYDFSVAAAMDGARYVFTAIEGIMCNEETVAKVRALQEGARDVRKMLLEGATRESLSVLLKGTYPEGYWKTWPGYKGQL